MTNQKPIPHQCFKCKQLLIRVGDHRQTVIYLSEEHDQLRTMPLCVRCAIVACFRCGKRGVA